MSISAYDHDHVYLASNPSGGPPSGISQQRIVTHQSSRPPGGAAMGTMIKREPEDPMIKLEPMDSHVTYTSASNYGVVYQPQPTQRAQQYQPSGIMNQPFLYQNVQLQPPPTSNSLNLSGLLREPTPEPEPIKEEPIVKVEEPDPTTSQPGFEEVEDDIDIQIRNVVCNYTLPLHIDLRKFALASANVTYDRGRGVLLKQKRNPHCYVKIYSSGKVYIVGCKSEDDCRRAARSVARHVQRAMGKLSSVVKIRNYKVCNVLATCRMPFGIKIEELAQKYPAQSQYEPELSVGLVWRSTDPKGTLRIHTTGSITVTGASSEADVCRAIEIIYPIVQEFRCSERHRAEKKKKSRKRAAPRGGGPGAKRGAASGAMGNKMYFSDEDDIYEEDDLDDDDF